MKRLFFATATPLASIFGSGFLIRIPILNGAVGRYSILAMALMCGVAYSVGSVIRFNIMASFLLGVLVSNTMPHSMNIWSR
ncbi:hypothetical protein [Gimesia aquarii]|uniref:Uncharacterized protein n=1 Tax=Gimesia aquarii TaxID=2527964 RepID=A0A517WXY0_9PLAN|nr:hypothetical protein [Gimesia aquarii]QDU10114.1 hypothetical protein V202x_35130 [Gimesia aquarii]